MRPPAVTTINAITTLASICTASRLPMIVQLGAGGGSRAAVGCASNGVSIPQRRRLRRRQLRRQLTKLSKTAALGGGIVRPATMPGPHPTTSSGSDGSRTQGRLSRPQPRPAPTPQETIRCWSALRRAARRLAHPRAATRRLTCAFLYTDRASPAVPATGRAECRDRTRRQRAPESALRDLRRRVDVNVAAEALTSGSRYTIGSEPSIWYTSRSLRERA